MAEKGIPYIWEEEDKEEELEWLEATTSNSEWPDPRMEELKMPNQAEKLKEIEA